MPRKKDKTVGFFGCEDLDCCDQWRTSYLIQCLSFKACLLTVIIYYVISYSTSPLQILRFGHHNFRHHPVKFICCEIETKSKQNKLLRNFEYFKVEDFIEKNIKMEVDDMFILFEHYQLRIPPEYSDWNQLGIKPFS